jgi:hypothetical protein
LKPADPFQEVKDFMTAGSSSLGLPSDEEDEQQINRRIGCGSDRRRQGRLA